MTVAATDWSGRKVTQARAMLAGVTTWPTRCARCPRIIGRDDDWVLGHKVPRWERPDLTWEPSNWQVECRPCSDASGQAEALAKARAEGARAALKGDFSGRMGPRQPPPLPISPSSGHEQAWTVEPRLRWAHHVATAPDWLAPYLVVPEDASPPLAMTEVHPLAVCSYAAEGCQHAWKGVPFVVPPSAIAWVEQTRNLTLRWWQRLAFVRQLEHDAAGRLVWRTIVESGTRRIGKSERLRSMALWRMEHGVELFEPGQTVIHFGNKLDVVREVQERAWPWCEARGWDVSRNNNNRSVTHPNGARWLAKTTAYSFDVHLGLADECWDIEPVRITEDLEPAALERESAQVVLTSTSHRRATTLMKRRISAALAADDGRTLLLLFGMEPGADIFDEETWRAASAHWTRDRRDTIAAKLLEARETEPSLDDPDPIGSWANQYLNRWDLVVRPKVKGEEAIDAESWVALIADRPDGKPAAAAIEAYGDGVSLILAWRTGSGIVLVSASDHADVPDAAAALRLSGFRGRVTVGASLVEHPALRKRSKRSGEGQVIAAVQELQRLVTEAVVRHDGGEHLTGQVMQLRTAPSTNGLRMASTERADAVKATVWAVRAARSAPAITGIVLPSL